MTAYDVMFDRLLTRVDAERAHHAALRAIRVARPGLQAIRRRAESRHPDSAAVRALGLTFANPLGLAAGFDKNGVGIDALAALGFGHVEVGTVTGEPQPGNPRPRLFRLPADRAILNRMGFNNDGAERVARRLAARQLRLSGNSTGIRGNSTGMRGNSTGMSGNSTVVGVNIGKTKVVPEERAVADYEKSTGLLAPHADYLVVNVSSPNTPGLRDLQAVERLEPLLVAVRRRADAAEPGRRVPLLVKIAPDLDDDDLLAVADLAMALGLDGIVATNTTVSRNGLATPAEEVRRLGAGGLSGAPLAERSRQVLGLLRARVGPGPALISVGGIGSPEEARARLAAGATLVQAYTGFVYGGPRWPSSLARGLAAGNGAATAVDPEEAP